MFLGLGSSTRLQRLRILTLPLISALLVVGVLIPGALSADDLSESEAAGRVSGRVIDRESGSPLSGVTVRLVRFGPTSPKLEVTTGEDGGFSFDSVPEGKAHLWLGGGYVVWDEDSTNPGNSTAVDVRANGDEPVRVLAVKGIEVAGRALDVSSGRPFPGLRLCLTSEAGGEVSYSEDVTTAEGVFSFSAQRGGRAQLSVIPMKHFICVLPPGQTGVLDSTITSGVIPFARVSRVEGHVSSLLPGKTGDVWVELFARTVKSGPDGKRFVIYPRCDIAKISPGERFMLYAFGAPPDAQGSLKAYVLGRGEGESVPFHLYAGGGVDGAAVPLKGGVSTGAVEGIVVDEEGQPIRRALVEDESHRGKLTNWEPAVYTDSEGRFVLWGISPSVGRRTLFVTAPGYTEAKVAVKIKKGKMTSDVRIEMEGRGVRGRWWVLRPGAGRYAPPVPEAESR
jgi:hypothetical protein